MESGDKIPHFNTMRKADAITILIFTTIFSAILCTILIPDRQLETPQYKYPMGWHRINSKYGSVRMRVPKGWLYASAKTGSRFIYVED